MSTYSRKEPRFSWDYDRLNNAFWNSLNYVVGRNFLQCYTESKISRMTFDESLPLAEKLAYLRSQLDETFSGREEEGAPVSFHDADYKAWKLLKLGMSTTDQFVGNTKVEEKFVREMYENGPDGTRDVNVLLQLSEIMEATGRYAEREAMEREVLPWLQGHEMLGKDSPQANSYMRHLASNIWKQRRYEEGGE